MSSSGGEMEVIVTETLSPAESHQPVEPGNLGIAGQRV